MTTQFITNNKGEKTAVIVPIAEYEDLMHQHHVNLELTDEYKIMMDDMLLQEANGQAEYVSLDKIKAQFADK